MKKTMIFCIAMLAVAALSLPKMPQWFDSTVNQDIETYAYTMGNEGCDDSQEDEQQPRHSIMRTLKKVCTKGKARRTEKAERPALPGISMQMAAKAMGVAVAGR